MISKIVLCGWLSNLSFMQQTVLLSAIRGPDGLTKHHPCKPVVRALRRSILKDAFTKREFTTFSEVGGGSFAGSILNDADEYSFDVLANVIKDYYNSFDTLPMHFHMHMLHAAEILGYKHPNVLFRNFWLDFYSKGVKYMHLTIETEAELDSRLGDTEEGWKTASVYDN